MTIEDLEEKFEGRLQEYTSEYDYSYDYRIAEAFFETSYVEQYMFDIRLEHNKQDINESLKDAKKKLQEVLTNYREIKNLSYYLDVADASVIHCLKWAFNQKFDKEVLRLTYGKSFINLINDAIKSLSKVEQAAYEFLEQVPYEIIQEVFK